MRLDVPHELPRRRPEPAPAAPLEPTPLERRREQLQNQAEQRRMPEIPRPRRERAGDSRSRTVPHDRPVERRQKRDQLPRQVIGISLREEERKVLAEVGRFRVIATRDLAESVYDGRTRQMQQDLRYLREQGLVDVDTVTARRDGRGGRVERIEVVTLTRDGRSVARQTSGLPDGQKLYYGMVKPREVEHDAQIYRAYQKEAGRIEKDGGSNLRVHLDFEIKSDVQKAIYAERKADPKRDMAEIKQEVAERLELPFVDGKIQIPDARIEYDLPRDADQEIDERSRTGHADVEVLTAAYRPGHLRAKAQSGFHVYASSSDRATLTAKIEDDHHMMRSILEL